MDDAVPEPTREQRTLQAVDDMLAPAFRMCENVGVVSYSQLKAALATVRQALAFVVYGPPEPPVSEPVDALAEQQAAQEAERVRIEQEAADGPKSVPEEPAPEEPALQDPMA